MQSDGKGEHHCHPERVVAVGGMDAVERRAVSLDDVLRCFEVIEGVVLHDAHGGVGVGMQKEEAGQYAQHEDEKENSPPASIHREQLLSGNGNRNSGTHLPFAYKGIPARTFYYSNLMVWALRKQA